MIDDLCPTTELPSSWCGCRRHRPPDPKPKRGPRKGEHLAETCKRGHPLIPENLQWVRGQGRRCKLCKAIRREARLIHPIRTAPVHRRKPDL